MRDGRWIPLLNIYPKAKTRALAFLGSPDNHQAISQVTRKWNAFELEEDANRAGLQATVIRSAEEFLETFYNRHRAHATLQYMSPIDYEKARRVTDSSCPGWPRYIRSKGYAG